MSEVLNWPMDEMVLSILEVERLNRELLVLKKYGCDELLEAWIAEGVD
jgi:hypothetical protein